jgi:uncharacterized protein YfaT (DUF1175 family)
MATRNFHVGALSILLFGIVFGSSSAVATPSKNPDVIARRGGTSFSPSKAKPEVVLLKPAGGWTTARMVDVSGSCTDEAADPIHVNINGSQYFVRSRGGNFSRKFPVSPGRNNVSVECRNAAGVGRVERSFTAAINPVRMKIVLTSDTDGVYTDLHLYEPDGHHVYWASTDSPTGGLFFLNNDGGSWDKPGYGPYMYVHPAPPVGTFRIDVNYWPGGAIRHTAANLDVIIDEGLPTEMRRRVRKALALPSETQTLAWVVFPPNRGAPRIFVPGQDPESERPQDVPPKKSEGHDWGLVAPKIGPMDEQAFRTTVANLALQQSLAISPAWDPGQRDCAGLVRFAWREALRPRSRSQRSVLKIPDALPLPGVSVETAMRFAGGDFWQTGHSRDGKPQFGSFADASALVAWNFVKVGMDATKARKGDLLVFRRDDAAEETWHLMIVADDRPGRELFVWHNGDKPGAIRVASLEDLLRAPVLDWQPRPFNQRFLGVYQWRHLRGDSGASVASL